MIHKLNYLNSLVEKTTNERKRCRSLSRTGFEPLDLSQKAIQQPHFELQLSTSFEERRKHSDICLHTSGVHLGT